MSDHPNMMQVGDIMVCSWGYEQTNVDFYQVVSVSSKSVMVREIAKATVPGSVSGMSDQVVAVHGRFIADAEPMRKRITSGIYARMPNGILSKWDGRPKHRSWWA